MLHVAYKGSPQYTVDLLAGRIDLVMAAAGALLPHIKSGRLRLLAVSTAGRDPALPDTPTMIEAGVPGFEVIGWFGLLTTAGTPPVIVNRLFDAIARVLKEPDVKNIYANAGLDVAISKSPADFAALISREREKWAQVIKAAKIKIE
jgi:tripartite-type tricarboxylate transporter receptor subunit TctC